MVDDEGSVTEGSAAEPASDVGSAAGEEDEYESYYESDGDRGDASDGLASDGGSDARSGAGGSDAGGKARRADGDVRFSDDVVGGRGADGDGEDGDAGGKGGRKKRRRRKTKVDAAAKARARSKSVADELKRLESQVEVKEEVVEKEKLYIPGPLEQFKGEYSIVERADECIVAEQDLWEVLWEKTLFAAAPPIDFTSGHGLSKKQNFACCVFLGQVPQGGYNVLFHPLKRWAPDKTLVEYSVERPVARSYVDEADHVSKELHIDIICQPYCIRIFQLLEGTKEAIVRRRLGPDEDKERAAGSAAVMVATSRAKHNMDDVEGELDEMLKQ